MMLQKRENGVGAKMTHNRLEGNRIIGLNEEVNTMPAKNCDTWLEGSLKSRFLAGFVCL